MHPSFTEALACSERLQGAGSPRGIARLSPVVLKKAVRGKLSLVNIVGDVDGLSKVMLLTSSEKIA